MSQYSEIIKEAFCIKTKKKVSNEYIIRAIVIQMSSLEEGREEIPTK